MATNETSPAHTPTPFGVFVSPGDELYLAQVSENGAQIKHLCILTCDDVPAENAANAEFIARACNAHDELLEALKHAEERLNEIPHNYMETNFKMIREAIAKAEHAQAA